MDGWMDGWVDGWIDGWMDKAGRVRWRYFSYTFLTSSYMFLLS